MEDPRKAILRSFKSGSDTVSSAIALALSFGIYPIFHVHELRTKYNFDPDSISYTQGRDRESVQEIFECIDLKRNQGKFEEIEFNKFYIGKRPTGMTHAYYMERIIRYFKESGKLDDQTFEEIFKNTIFEKERIKLNFTANDVSFEEI